MRIPFILRYKVVGFKKKYCDRVLLVELEWWNNMGIGHDI